MLCACVKIKNKSWQGPSRNFYKLLACELEEDAKALIFLKVRPHESSIVQSYGQLEVFAII